MYILNNGIIISNICQEIIGDKEIKILMIGPETVGKTNILSQWNLEESITEIPNSDFKDKKHIKIYQLLYEILIEVTK